MPSSAQAHGARDWPSSWGVKDAAFRHDVRLWANEPEVSDSITRSRINERFLPGFILPESIAATSDLNTALEGAEIVVSVMPSQHCRALFERMTPSLRPETLFVSCTKGLEDGLCYA